MKRWALVLLCFGVAAVGGKKRSAKDWSKVDMDAIAEAWKEGDGDEELRTEHEEYEAVVERRKAEAGGGGGIDLEALKTLSADEIKRTLGHQQSKTGMSMIFVTMSLVPPASQGGGAEWTEAAETKEATRLQAMLKTGGQSVSVYRIDPRRLLLTQMMGWYGTEVIDFLLTQPTVMKVTWDQIDYTNPYVEQGESEEERAQKVRDEELRAKQAAARARKTLAKEAREAALEAAVEAARAEGRDEDADRLLAQAAQEKQQQQQQQQQRARRKRRKKAKADL